jgi:chloramphenicol O-acetyltransferase type A
MKYLDTDNWNRKSQYEFFREYEEPYFGVCVSIDVTLAYENAKKKGRSFFLSYLHATIQAANEIEEFRYRVSDDRVVIHDIINASATISRPDNTFGFSYIDFDYDFATFRSNAQKEIDRINGSYELLPTRSTDDVLYLSSMPWLDFMFTSHARAFKRKGSAPMISYGKMTEKEGKRSMPVSIHVHHALMDGYHVGLFVDLFQKILNDES